RVEAGQATDGSRRAGCGRNLQCPRVCLDELRLSWWRRRRLGRILAGPGAHIVEVELLRGRRVDEGHDEPEADLGDASDATSAAASRGYDLRDVEGNALPHKG